MRPQKRINTPAKRGAGLTSPPLKHSALSRNTRSWPSGLCPSRYLSSTLSPPYGRGRSTTDRRDRCPSMRPTVYPHRTRTRSGVCGVGPAQTPSPCMPA
ncbi:hypothetical protein PsYK624_112430 [Phanerochaete sordida]|uniref:Uncharacterized protein n=1 Tax=Phanerochaete sordida TaxID=48140 RepID=A0A9P3LHW8_9APHY|nr:hypothetical protein PsYK624_112430 [Phanerochaete sordida]